MLACYQELSKDNIDINVYLKNIKLFLQHIIEELKLKSTIHIDKIGIGCGPIVGIEDENFVLRIYSSSFGSSDKLSQCYVMIQPICKSMPEPYNLGFVMRYSLAYYANNPHYVISNLKKAMKENSLWKKIKPYMLKEKYIAKPENNFDKLENTFNKLNEVLNKLEFAGPNRIDVYWSKIKNLYLNTKQKLINSKQLKCKYTETFQNYGFVPLKHFNSFAEKQECKVFGKTRKYFYNSKTKYLFCAENATCEIKYIKLKKEKFKKYKSKLEFDFKLHSKLFKNSNVLFLKTTRIYVP